MTPNYKITKTPKQIEAIRLITKVSVACLYGGSRSGKTFIVLYAMVIRALRYASSRQLVARFRFAHAKQSICYDTMPKLLGMLGIANKIELNKTDWFYQFPNGSTIWIGGLDDKDRVEKILGNEYATIFLNEASQISFNAYETIITRLNPPAGCKGKIIIDYNPPSTSHWGYKMFERHELPDGRKLPLGNYLSLQMNPEDNQINISPEYIAMLQNLSAHKRNRYLHGTYSTDSGTMWKRGWIKYKAGLPDFERIVVGVDPAGSAGGDEIGIIVAGKYKQEYWILDDYSLHGTPSEWSREVVSAYNKWQADVVAAERNYGGDMVASTIKTAGPNVNVKMVTATRGKAIRAEPISALYEQGKVYHRIPFIELEDELCIYEPDQNESPNRLDALVWAITYMYDVVVMEWGPA